MSAARPPFDSAYQPRSPLDSARGDRSHVEGSGHPTPLGPCLGLPWGRVLRLAPLAQDTTRLGLQGLPRARPEGLDVRPGAREPASGTSALRRGAWLDWAGVRRPWCQWSQGPAAYTRCARQRCETPQVRRARVLAVGSPRKEPPTSRHPDRGTPDHGDRVHLVGRGIDCTTPAGKLQLHILAALAGFERARI